MQSISSLELNRLVIHAVSNMSDAPEIADKEETLSDSLRHFFEEHILNCVRSTAARTGKFNGSDTTVASCVATIVERPEDFVEQCRVMGMWFAHSMERTSEVQTFLAIGLLTDLDTDERYVALLKLDPIKAFVRRGATAFEQISILPDPARQLMRFAVARPYDDESRYDIVFRNSPASKDEDPETSGMWMDGFLAAYEVATPRQMTQLVVKETEKWIAANEEVMEDESAQQLRNAVRELSQSEEMDVEAIAAAAIKDDRMREEYIGRLLDRGLSETTFRPDREWAERTARKTTYLCDDGVQISGPSDAIDDVVQVLPKTPDRKTRLVVETRKFQQK